MNQEDADPVAEEAIAPRAGRKRLRKALVLVALLLAAAILFAWLQRTRIADNILARELAGRGIEARYTIAEIGPTRQVLTDLVIGDPEAPDLTIDRLVIRIRPRLGFPAVTGISLVNPRLFGSWRNGELSFGALDPLLFTGEEDAPFELPDMVLSLQGGQALIETDYGPVGISLAGEGNLQSGFSAELAAAAPELAISEPAGQGCAVEGATLYGTLSVDAERPRFRGPLRFGALACADQGLTLAGGSVALNLGADRALTAWEGEAGLALGALSMSGARLATLEGDAQFTWRDEALTARYDLAAQDVSSTQASAATLGLEGLLRTRRGFERVELEGDLTGRGIAPGAALDSALASAAEASAGTLAAPLLDQIRRQLARESRNSTLAAAFTARMESERRQLLIPSATLTGASGESLLALSRAAITASSTGAPLLAGNFSTGGDGLPRLAGQFARDSVGATRLTLAMAPYTAGEARLALPALSVSLDASGAMDLSGHLLASGPLPGGSAQNLALPITGGWSPERGLALWPGCTRIAFERLAFSNLTLQREDLTLCPPRGSSIVRYDDAGLRIAAGAPALDLAGTIGATPVTIASGPVGLAWPGVVTASDLAIALGPPDTASRFAISSLTADLSQGIGGVFTGADIRLAAVPLDLLGATGEWRYADGRLQLSQGAFTLEDRSEVDRFRPLVARDASLALVDNVITADAALREPRTDAVVTNLALRHDLATGTGLADLAVPGIAFGRGLQPTDLTDLALGVVALVDGTVTGSGRIDWNAAAITSTGRFSSDDLDFAAAFGPVEGASGTVEFTDLIGLTTAPRQRLKVRSVNPGIEVYDGEIALQLRGGQFLDLQLARWPFLGGTLTMRPLTIAIGVAEERGYILQIEGLETARFVERMQLGNLSATGTLDGTIPVIFDAQGNGRLQGGLLRSRPPGGNVAYVGQLTYEDLSPMANFAFDALRSLDYRQLSIALDGPLTGELVTRVNLEGVRQGEGTQQNFITRRLARLPIRLIVNLRAPFYRLISSVRSLYDPSAVRDPRELGLVGNEGEVLQSETDQDAVDALDALDPLGASDPGQAADPPPSDIQQTESEPVP